MNQTRPRSKRVIVLGAVMGLLALWLLRPGLVRVGYFIKGHLAGEAFYEGRPASHWARDLRVGTRWNLWDRFVNVGMQPDATKAKNAMKTLGAAAVPALSSMLDSGNSQVRSEAASTLAQIGADAKEAVPALHRALKDAHNYIRHDAAAVLGKIGPEARVAVPTLIEMLSDADGSIREAAADALGGIGPDAKDAIPKLVELLRTDRLVNDNAGKALGRIGDDGIAVLIDLLKGQDREVWPWAASGLGEAGPAAKAAVPLLERGVSDGHVTMYFPDVLIELLASTATKPIRVEAVHALEKIGPEARDAVPSLKKLLNDLDTELRNAADDALKKINPTAAPD